MVAGLSLGLFGSDRLPRYNRSSQFTLTQLAVEGDRQGNVSLAGVWHMTSTDLRLGSYSALAARPRGRLMAYADSGWWLSFVPPGNGRPMEARFGSNADPYYDPPANLQWLDDTFRPDVERRGVSDTLTAVAMPGSE